MSPSNLRGHRERKTWKYKLEFVALYIISILSFGEVKAQENINFYLHENGITIMCPDASNGETGIIDGVEYTKRTKKQITIENAGTTCTSGIEDMTDIFYYKRNFNGDISHWDVSSVKNMYRMFYTAESFNQDISHWDVSSTTNMGYIFSKTPFNQDISKWDVSSVTNMENMFYESQFNQPIGNWNVSSVTNMRAMFTGTVFNQDISEWDVSSVNDMDYMFIGASAFNQNLKKWCVSFISTDPKSFSNGSPLTEKNKPKWGTCPSK